MVYIYVCKRFKVTMDMVSGKDGDWVNNLLASYCKHTRIHAILERAEINPKKRMSTNSYDSSTDVFKINLVYKDTKGCEHELKWLIKVTRSDINQTADTLLRHEKLVFSLLMGDLINIVKQKAAGRLESARLSHKELLNTPEFIFEESAHQADILRNVLVLDNLEEKLYAPSLPPLNLAHLKIVVKTMAKFHAVTFTYKKAMFDSFAVHSEQVAARRNMDDVEIEGENKVLTGRMGLFDRFPFLVQRLKTMNHLVENRQTFLDMYQRLLEATVGSTGESCLIDTLEYIRMSTDDILRMEENVEDPKYVEHPLDSIALGVLEARSFLFNYEPPETKKKEGAKLQRSQSERRVKKDLGSSPPKKGSAAVAALKTAKIEKQKSLPKNSKFPQNKFLFQNRSKDDANVEVTNLKKNAKIVKERDPNEPPVSAALVNCKYVTYTRVTRDLAVLMFTTADSLVRRFYLIKLVETYCETLGITLGQLGIDTDTFGMNYHSVINDFQQHILYGFIVGLLIGMANTNPDELEAYCNNDEAPKEKPPEAEPEAAASAKFVPLTEARIKFLVDLMRDVAYYVESKDFELGLPITNFHRYHELWSMKSDFEEEEYEDYDEEEDYEEEE